MLSCKKSSDTASITVLSSSVVSSLKGGNLARSNAKKRRKEEKKKRRKEEKKKRRTEGEKDKGQSKERKEGGKGPRGVVRGKCLSGTRQNVAENRRLKGEVLFQKFPPVLRSAIVCIPIAS